MLKFCIHEIKPMAIALASPNKGSFGSSLLFLDQISYVEKRVKLRASPFAFLTYSQDAPIMINKMNRTTIKAKPPP